MAGSTCSWRSATGCSQWVSLVLKMVILADLAARRAFITEGMAWRMVTRLLLCPWAARLPGDDPPAAGGRGRVSQL